MWKHNAVIHRYFPFYYFHFNSNNRVNVKTGVATMNLGLGLWLLIEKYGRVLGMAYAYLGALVLYFKVSYAGL